MNVKVRLFGDVADQVGRKHDIELDDTETVLSLTNKLQEKSGFSRLGYLGNFKVGGSDLAIMVNGKNIALLQEENTRLNDGDDVVIMPFVVGG
jgi:MoaD family protein